MHFKLLTNSIITYYEVYLTTYIRIVLTNYEHNTRNNHKCNASKIINMQNCFVP